MVAGQVEFRLLGPVEAWHGDKRVELGQPRQRATLAVLLTEANRVLSPAALISRVWGEQAPPSARSALYGHLTRLRAVLARLDKVGEPVRLHRISGGYLLEVDPDAVDLHRFGRLVDQARGAGDADQAAARWADALKLWRGAPYEGLTSEWLDAMRGKLEQRHLAAVLERNQVELDRGQHAELLPELVDMSGRHPLDERLTGQLMIAQYRSGRQAEALHLYQTVRARLADELGVDPGAELRTLHDRMLHDDHTLAVPHRSTVTNGKPAGPGRDGRVPAQLPPDVPGFVGRAGELARLDALHTQLSGQPSALVISAVSGTAGIGKTTLAVHWAHRVASQFPDGQLYVNLRGFDPSGRVTDPAEAVRGFLDALAVPPERIPSTMDAQVALYRSLLSGKRMLVVLDNARDADQVRPLLPGTPTCLAVVTSRSHLAPLVAVDGAHPLSLDTLSTVEAQELLARRLGADRVAAEPDAVEQVITACARLPLALAIAAGRAAQERLPLAALAAELDKADQRLDALDAGDRASQMRAVFSWSYTALTPPAAWLFRLLGLHPGPDLSVPAAASLAGHDRPGTRRLLTELTRANLIVEHVAGRYTFHDLLRAYASDLTHTHDSADQRRAALTRLLDHYLHTAYAADRVLNPHRDPIRLPLAPPAADTRPEDPADHQQAMAWLAAEHRVLLAALRLATDCGFDTHTWQLAWAVDTFLGMRGYWHDQASAMQAGVSAAGLMNNLAAEADLRRRLGYANTRVGRHDEAHTHLKLTLDLYTQAGDLAGQADTHRSLSYMYERQGRLDEALDHSQLALTMYRAAGHRRGEADVLNEIGWDHARLGDYAQALIYCEQALTLHRQLGHWLGEGPTWDSLGYAHHHLGHYAEAADCYQQALTLRRARGARFGEATTLIHLGETYHAAGNPDGARDAWQQALDILTELPDAEAVRAKLRDLQALTATG